MVEKLVDILKIFLEKYFIPTIIAVVLSFVTYYITPEDNAVLIKFGVMGFSVCCFLIWFLIVEMVMGIFKGIISAVNRKIKGEKRQIYENDRIERENKEILEVLWTRVDEMNARDYQLLVEFINNGNQPHYEAGQYFGDCLLNSDWVHKTVVQAEKQVPIKIERSSMEGIHRFPIYETISARYQYVLKDELYKALKYSMDKHGKISHFER
ncbi:hypothetical protein [Faecalicatena contorta]|uniref:Uncharacterized protein n=1 Tax=Faecalicatena contorta TaxID=39482 RepID=A0A315ZQE1_9FIRM|nr:hypothetical protein [Faecalicatena contorta]PWJ47791.1 hypothetical protein A8805_11646 [Faecalicatena contorta]SUQ15785.1 hypothetical protein SAMN05216529_11646 [Faecalicatena contorta]